MRERKFVRVAMSANRDGYYSVVLENDGEHWYGPWPTRQYAENHGKGVVSYEANRKKLVARMRFNGE
jgi:hypothetical protein